MAQVVLVVIIIFGGICAAVAGQRLTEREWPGWILGVVVAVLLAAVFAPALNALSEAECTSSGTSADCADD